MRRRSPLLRSLLAALGLLNPALLPAQTVVEVQGGGSSLLGGYGATANFWRSGVDGWIGLGYLRGLRAGAFLRTAWGKDTLRVGNDALVVRFPTDLFSAGTNLLVQGASYGGGMHPAIGVTLPEVLKLAVLANLDITQANLAVERAQRHTLQELVDIFDRDRATVGRDLQNAEIGMHPPRRQLTVATGATAPALIAEQHPGHSQRRGELTHVGLAGVSIQTTRVRPGCTAAASCSRSPALT